MKWCNFWGQTVLYFLELYPSPPSSSSSGDQESCRHSVDSQGSGGVPRKQMRLDHFTAATQHLDCGFDRHHYPPDSFGSASGSKTEQVKTRFTSDMNWNTSQKKFTAISRYISFHFRFISPQFSNLRKFCLCFFWLAHMLICSLAYIHTLYTNS